MIDAFAKMADGVKYAAPRIAVGVESYGRIGKTGEIASADYWRRHLREPVRFSASIAALLKKDIGLFLEVGPAPTLSGYGKALRTPGTGTWVSSLNKGRDDWEEVLESLATLYVHGAQVDWEGFERGRARRRLSLPTYPFQRKRYWFAENKAASAN